MLQQAHEAMARTPEPGRLKFQCSSPLFGLDRIPLCHQTPKNSDASNCATYANDRTNIAAAAAEDVPTDGLQVSSERLSDVHLASRKANEAAARRSQAASWLHRMVGPLDLPLDPSEEELRLCLRNGLVLCNLINKIHPGAVLKIVENPAPSSPPPQGAALSAYQYFENVRNFLVAVEELKLPSFQASDLEKGSLQTGSSAKVVDCILALKAYQEWQLNGGQGLWKFAGAPYKSPCTLNLKCSSRTGSSRASEPHLSKVNSQFRKGWAFSGLNGPKNLFEELGSPFCHAGKLGQPKGHSGSEPFEESEIEWSNTDFGAAWIQHVSQKFGDVLHIKVENSQEAPMVRMPETTNGLDSISSESLLKLVMLALHDKQPEEVPVLVEFMLRKVMEEFERRLLCQEEQWKQSNGAVLEDLRPAISDCLEKQAELRVLEMELERVQNIGQQRSHILESQNEELQRLKLLLEATRFEFHDMQGEWRTEMEALDTKLHGLTQAAEEYHKVVAENRELYNQVQDLKGNIRVYCRVRPFLPGQSGSQSTVDFVGEKGSIMIVNPNKQGKDQRKSFHFNRVFGPSASQEDVFLDTQPLIRSVLDGFNVCIFAYGQTGSGKTYTMTGPNNPSSKDWGVNFRALNDLFQISQNRKDFMRYDVGVQMMEIYNEQVRDLLCSDGSNRKLEIRNSSQQNGLNVPAASMLPVGCTEDVLELMTLGHKNRAVGATALNERSSRSHSVLTVHVKGTDLASGAILRGCLHLVDLAGSERVEKSEATGDRLKEAQYINKSLSALGDVVAALAQKSAHVPYRNSKLTQLLQDSLGGQAKTLMFVHASPDEDSYSETISTLKFAERVATIELGAAHSNKESGEVRDLKDQIAFLKDALAKKDVELERFQKDLRSKPVECVQEKARMKPGTSPGQFQLRRTSMDVVQGQGKRRQPLEEVRNSEVRHGPGNLSIAGQKCLPSADVQSIDLAQAHSPNVSGNVYCEDDPVKRRAEEDSVKRRASKLSRQAAASPDEESRSSPCFEFPFEAPSIRGVISKNKIRREASVDPEAVNSISTPQEKEAVRASRSFSVQSDVTPVNRSIHGVGQTMSLRFDSGKKAVEEIGTRSTTTTCSFEGAVSRLRQSHLKPFCSQDDEDSTEVSTGQRTCVQSFEEDAATSECSEDVETWQKEAGPPTFMHGTKGNKRRSADSRRVSTTKQSLSSLPKVDSSAPAAVRRHTRSRRSSLLGAATTPGLEMKKAGGKATTLEAKLIAVSSEGGTLECYAKATLPRQSTTTTQAAAVQKSSKRWV